MDHYQSRWTIEEFFKTLKTGCAFEKRQLESFHALVRAVDRVKTSPADVARAIVEGVEQGLEGIFPDPMSRSAFDTWRRNTKELERQLASMSGRQDEFPH